MKFKPPCEAAVALQETWDKLEQVRLKNKKSSADKLKSFLKRKKQ